MDKDTSDTGILLINLGTPDSTNTSDVRKYLKEFLMDPYVVNAPSFIRAMIVYGFILPTRPKKSAEAYSHIWTDEGSPLLVGSTKLCQALQAELNMTVELAMRYGNPSISDGLHRMKKNGFKHVLVVPLYPQYADSTVTTSIEKVRSELPSDISAEVLPTFFSSDHFIKPWVNQIKKNLPADWDHLLLSYHGIPDKHLKIADQTNSHCLTTKDCCDMQSPAWRTCYKHQVFETSKRIAKALGIPDSKYTVNFQSRLGPVSWLKPYTDKTLEDLPGKGVKRLVLASPAFLVDNLETIEELGMEGRELFEKSGGESLTLIPCLNDNPQWVKGLAAICKDHLDRNRPRELGIVHVSS